MSHDIRYGNGAAWPGTRLRSSVARGVAAGALAVRAAPMTLALHVVVALVGGAQPVVIAWLTKLVLDDVAAGARVATLLPLAASLGAAGLVAAVLPQLTQYLRAEFNRAVGLLAQDRLFGAVDRLVGLAQFEDPRFLDRVRLARDAGGSGPGQVVDGTLGLLQAVVTITGFLASLLLLSPMMTGLVLLAGVPTLAAELALSRRRARMYWDLGPVERRELFYSQLLTSVEAAKEIRLFGIGTFLRGRMLADRRTANASLRAMDRREAMVQSGLGGFAALVAGGGLLWAVSATRSGGLSVGDVAIFVAAVAGIQGAVAVIALEIARTHQSLLMFDHYLSVTRCPPDLPVAPNPRPLPPLRDAIEFRDVWFRYSPEHAWILRGVTLRVPYGKALALIGLNGAGKSTLIKLLCRYYDPTRGAILWDGADLREIDPADLRHRIGAVFQDYMEYDMTAAENIALGDLSSLDDRERIHTAARRADLHDRLTELPRGYDTLLSRMFFMDMDMDRDRDTSLSADGEKGPSQTGVELSGGQWQRLALARAFLRDQRDLMILDEPSAGLDAEAEAEIHSSLTQYRAGRTSLLISHRLGAVRDADVIAVLADGRILEQGDHASLTAMGGEYARLFDLQASGYRDNAT
ncbi:ABC transporter ATP-binding protein [Streptomyces sp. NPDC056358]|uniref:ABC transporter ATP-binding protein n=1 Tax=Streptomyces sp. NPDC056358 TaxID=3345794 RepID=UPI0035D63A5F